MAACGAKVTTSGKPKVRVLVPRHRKRPLTKLAGLSMFAGTRKRVHKQKQLKLPSVRNRKRSHKHESFWGGMDQNGVFINCPIDKEYEKLFVALVGTLIAVGLTPRCAIEIGATGKSRQSRHRYINPSIASIVRTTRQGALLATPGTSI